jgi:ubiquinol-cytochrome c reductase cytochrome b subunit
LFNGYGFSVNNAFLKPILFIALFNAFSIAGASIVHIAALHQKVNNPLGINASADKISFTLFSC